MQQFIISLLMLACLPVYASDLTVLAGYQFNRDFEVSANQNVTLPANTAAGDDVDADSGAVFGIALDFVLNNNSSQRWGFFLSHQQAEFGQNTQLANVDLDITHFHLTFMNYYTDKRFEPFVLGGVGMSVFAPADSTLDDEELFSGQLGFGANYAITESVLLRGDVRWLATFFDSDSSIFCDGGCIITVKSDIYSQFQTNLGLMFRF